MTQDTEFEPGDHRNWRMTTNARRKAWMEDGLQKVEQLQGAFVDGHDRTVGQLAIQFALRSPVMASVLPNIYSAANLEEYAATFDAEPLSHEEYSAVQDLYRENFGFEHDLRGQAVAQ